MRERARSKIERVVRSNSLAGRNIDTPDTTKGGVEDPERCSKEELTEAELKGAKVRKEDVEKCESIATAPIYGAYEDGTDAEDDSEDDGGTTEDKPNDSEPTWESLELAKNAYTKTVETSHGLKVLYAESTLADSYLAMGDGSIEPENYLLTVKDLEAALGRTRTCPEDSRSLAEDQYQLSKAQA